MKQSLAQALTGCTSMQDSDVHEGRVDRVRAEAAAQMPAVHRAQLKHANQAAKDSRLCAMGRHAVAFKSGNCWRSYAPLVSALAGFLKLQPDDARKVAESAIKEWAIDICPACKGARVVPDHSLPDLEGRQPMKSCETCGGTGKRHYDEPGRDLEPKLAKLVDVAKARLRQSESMVIEQYSKLLGRE